ncbi:MAG: hypothetical protein F6K17_05205 [Okeania sp. SIO3C4]|nr:hypothetical protein [Okeania sp. SIO3B3]NER02074.1 hypothetical protein [Okeania sp. SIO3C4]
MARPYSPNLSRPVIRAYQNQEGSQRQIAQRFQVSLTFVRNFRAALSKHRNCESKTTGQRAKD